MFYIEAKKILPYGKDHLSIEHLAVIKEYLGLVSDSSSIA